jgi:hypothetical protein
MAKAAVVRFQFIDAAQARKRERTSLSAAGAYGIEWPTMGNHTPLRRE